MPPAGRQSGSSGSGSESRRYWSGIDPHPKIATGAGRHESVCLERIDFGVSDGAAVLPVVAEIEDVFELLAGVDLARDFELGVVVPHKVGLVGVVGVADHSSVGEFELVQV